MSLRSFSGLRSFLGLLWLALGLLACDSAPRGALAIELAPTDRCSDATASFEADWECLRIQICESSRPGPVADAGALDAGTRDAGTPSSGCVEITTPGGDHEGATDELIVGRTALVAFDARVEAGREYDVSVTAYGAGGAPVATGRTRHVTPLGGEIRVRLHRYGMSSCGGVTDGNALPAHRAMGAAIPLPNGDVLFFGGATGVNVDAAQLTSVARFQRTVQVYDASASRFFDVAVTNNAESGAPPGFGRVMFEARDFGTEPDGRQRIRVFGGFGAVGPDATALRFDQNLLFTAYGLPFAPSNDTTAIAPVDILYDPSTRTATIDLVSTVGLPAAGGVGVSEVVGGRAVAVGGLSTNGGPTNLATLLDPTVSNALAVWGPTALVSSRPVGMMGVDDFGRHGATVTYLSGTDYLVWGGGLRVLSPAVYTDFAGVLVDAATSGVTVTPVAAPDLGPLPPPVAFHTATRLAPDHVLIAGGLPIRASYSTPAVVPTVQLSPAPSGLSILVNESGALRSVAVSGDPRAATILHQANVLASTGAVPTAILFTGGALTRPFPTAATLTTLWSSSEVGVVAGSADAWAYRAATTLRQARFGHTTTVIEGVGVLVMGGYREEIVGPSGAQQVRLQPVLEPEFFLIEDLLGLPLPPPVNCDDAGMALDAGRRDAPSASDAPTSDAGTDAGTDAPEVDVPDAPI